MAARRIGGGDGRGRIAPGGESERHLARARLHHAGCGGEPLEAGLVEADADAPVKDGDGRRHRAALAHDGLDPARRLEIGGIGHAVGDDGGFEGDHGPSGRERVGHLGRQDGSDVGHRSVSSSAQPHHAR